MACYQITINDDDGPIFYKVCLLSVLIAVSSIIDHRSSTALPCPAATPNISNPVRTLDECIPTLRYVTLHYVECHEAVAVLTFTMVEKYLGMCC
jgi:hypothetical protein